MPGGAVGLGGVIDPGMPVDNLHDQRLWRRGHGRGSVHPGPGGRSGEPSSHTSRPRREDMSATTTRARSQVTRTLELAPFERIELRDPANWVELTVEPGEAESITIDGPPDLVDRVRTDVHHGMLQIRLAGRATDRLRDVLTTSLNRRHLTYLVRARRILEVRVRGLVRVSVDAFGAGAPVVTSLEPQPPRPPFAGRP